MCTRPRHLEGKELGFEQSSCRKPTLHLPQFRSVQMKQHSVAIGHWEHWSRKTVFSWMPNFLQECWRVSLPTPLFGNTLLSWPLYSWHCGKVNLPPSALQAEWEQRPLPSPWSWSSTDNVPDLYGEKTPQPKKKNVGSSFLVATYILP